MLYFEKKEKRKRLCFKGAENFSNMVYESYNRNN